MTAKTAWQNRIIGHGTEVPDQLLANPRNWRVHPKAQQDALGGLLDTVGWVQDVIVNQRTGHVVDGHLRVSLAISRGEPSMPVVYVDLSESEEALVLASLDPLAAMAITDEEMLAELLGDVTADGALAAMLVSIDSSGFLADAMAAGDGKSAWPVTGGAPPTERNTFQVMLTIDQRSRIMEAVKATKEIDTAAGLFRLAEDYLCRS